MKKPIPKVSFSSFAITPGDSKPAFILDKNGFPIKSDDRNMRLAIDHLEVLIRFNTFSNQIEISGLEGFDDGELSDDAAIRLRFLIRETHGFLPVSDIYEQVLIDISRKNQYHPVRDYLNGLKWDGVKRIDNWLSAYGGAEDTAYHSAVGRIFLIAGVRRVRHPGSKFDTLVTLESPQGRNKSTAARILATRDEWFTDNLPIGADSREVIEQISGVWIAEFSELSGMGDREASHVRSFLSRQEDRARPAYGRRRVNVPRQFVPIGTSNDKLYLKDNENRRWWPVPIDTFDIEKLKADVDQLWAEAAHYEEFEGSGRESIILPEHLWPTASEIQRERRVDNPYRDVLKWLYGKEGWISGSDLWDYARVPTAQRFGNNAKHFGTALEELGFRLVQIRSSNDLRGPRGCRVYASSENGEEQIAVPVSTWEKSPF